MEISRISSRVTYHGCIKELHARGYIHYDLSYNHFRGSLVYMLGFDERQDRECTADPDIICTDAEPIVDSGWAGGGEEVGPSIDFINFINSLNKREAPVLVAGSENEQEGARKERRKEKGCAEKEKKAMLHGPLELEAFRFFHHYSANGWQLGRTPIQDWQAAARKWIINGINQNDDAGNQGNRAAVAGCAGERKDYGEPL